MEIETYKMIYEKERTQKKLIILGDEFVKNNKNRAKLIIENKKNYLTSELKMKRRWRWIYELKIKMILIKNLYNKSYMFKDCEKLIDFSIKDKNEKNIKDVNNYEEDNIKEKEKEIEVENIFDDDGYSSFNQSEVSKWFSHSAKSFIDLTITG